MIHFYRFCLMAICCLSCTNRTFSQVCTPTLSFNNLNINGVKASVHNVGLLWEGTYQVTPPPQLGATAPSALYSCGLAVAGKTASGNLKMAAQMSLSSYRGFDFFPGPLDSTGNVTRASCANFDRLFSIRRGEVNDFLFTNGRDISDNMKAWPAKGNPFFRAATGFDLPNQNLAPFVDVNRDGIYNPQNGDYPDFCGTSAYWWVFNDKGNTHTSSKGGAPLGIEVKGMAYGFNDPLDSALHYSTIYNYEIAYKGTEALDSAYVSLWIDPDLGCTEDDYFGCSPSNNLAFAYNADAADGNGAGFCITSGESYKTKIPVVGVKLLQTPKGENGQELGMTNFMYQYSLFDSTRYTKKAGWANTPSEYYNYMTSRWRDGSPLTSGGEGTSTTNTPTKYAYPARPNDTVNWNMPNSQANTIEKLMIMSCGPFKMLPGSRHRLAFAVVADLDVPRHPRVDISKLISRANSLQNVCTFPTAAKDIAEQNNTISVVPNPVSDEASFIYSGFINRVAIFNLTGQLMMATNDINSNVLKFSTQGMNAGIYVYRMTDNNGKSIAGRFTVVK